jgi:sensor histidine kinase regulating citrate/malate metabolism
MAGVGGCMDFQAHTERDIILDSIADGVFTVDKNWCITSFNRAAEQITGVPRAEAIGRPCREVLKANSSSTCCSGWNVSRSSNSWRTPTAPSW